MWPRRLSALNPPLPIRLGTGTPLPIVHPSTHSLSRCRLSTHPLKRSHCSYFTNIDHWCASRSGSSPHFNYFDSQTSQRSKKCRQHSSTTLRALLLTEKHTMVKTRLQHLQPNWVFTRYDRRTHRSVRPRLSLTVCQTSRTDRSDRL